MLGDPRNPNSLSSKLRRRRDVMLRQIIASISATSDRVRILDVGGTLEYWERVGIDFLQEKRAEIVLLNLKSSEISEVSKYTDLFTKAVGDGCDLSQYEDNQFELVHSNSVIEHVVTWSNMKSFALETRRVGRSYYVQTPYFWFPIDPHYYRLPFFHWLPRPTRARLLNALPITHSGRVKSVDSAYGIVDSARLLDGRQFRFLFPDGVHTMERFGILAKSMIVVRLPAELH